MLKLETCKLGTEVFVNQPRQWQRTRIVAAQAAVRPGVSVDVAVVGSGIIGIAICNSLLKRSGGALSVALLDKHQPCFGATGAGQGYIWLAHRDVGSPAWQLAAWSKALWSEQSNDSFQADAEWQEIGSLLLARNQAEMQQLREQAGLLEGAGCNAHLLTHTDLKDLEPALDVSDSMTGLLLKTDAQLNGRSAVEALMKQCAGFGERFVPLMEEGMGKLMRGASGRVQGIKTDKSRIITARKAVVLAAGAWTGPILADALGDLTWENSFSPRKGHLLEIEYPPGMPKLNVGLMEVGYTSHYKEKTSDGALKPMAVTFTATSSFSGKLLLGSSREFSGYSQEPTTEAVEAILERAAGFLPDLALAHPRRSHTRVGLRPYSRRGPVIGELPGAPGLFLACGHEGSGLTLAPATAELIVNHIFSEPVPEFARAFAP